MWEGAYMMRSCRAVAPALAVLQSAPAAAIESKLPSYSDAALLDTDNDMATGGEVGVVQGSETPHNEAGIDYIVAVLVGFNALLTTGGGGAATTPEPLVMKREVLKWDGASFQVIDTNLNTYPVGTNPDGNGLVEFGAPLELIGAPTGTVRGLFHASIVGANDYTQSFLIGGLRAAALSHSTLIGLGVLLVLSAVVLVRRRGRMAAGRVVAAVVLAAGVAWAADIMLDGNFADWAGISPVVSDPSGDSSIGDDAEDILRGYAVMQGSSIFFRMDLAKPPQSF
jgi:hypothetical protein